MEVIKRNVNLIGIATLALLLILYNLNTDDDIVYEGTITGVETYSLKSVETEFLVIDIHNGQTVKVAGNEYYQTVGKPVEVIESTNILGNKSYKLKTQ
jgi:hypothetical protein